MLGIDCSQPIPAIVHTAYVRGQNEPLACSRQLVQSLRKRMESGVVRVLRAGTLSEFLPGEKDSEESTSDAVCTANRAAAAVKAYCMHHGITEKVCRVILPAYAIHHAYRNLPVGTARKAQKIISLTTGQQMPALLGNAHVEVKALGTEESGGHGFSVAVLPRSLVLCWKKAFMEQGFFLAGFDSPASAVSRVLGAEQFSTSALLYSPDTGLMMGIHRGTAVSSVYCPEGCNAVGRRQCVAQISYQLSRMGMIPLALHTIRSRNFSGSDDVHSPGMATDSKEQDALLPEFSSLADSQWELADKVQLTQTEEGQVTDFSEVLPAIGACCGKPHISLVGEHSFWERMQALGASFSVKKMEYAQKKRPVVLAAASILLCLLVVGAVQIVNGYRMTTAYKTKAAELLARTIPSESRKLSVEKQLAGIRDTVAEYELASAMVGRSLLDVFDTVSKALPKGSTLQSFVVAGKQYEVAGRASSSAQIDSIVRAIRKNSLLTNVTVKKRVAKGTGVTFIITLSVG